MILRTSLQYKNPKGEPSKPLPHQDRFHNSDAKFKLLSGGLGAGKSAGGALEAANDILNSTSDNWGGFTELVLHQRLDLSLEVLVLQQRCNALFVLLERIRAMCDQGLK